MTVMALVTFVKNDKTECNFRLCWNHVLLSERLSVPLESDWPFLFLPIEREQNETLRDKYQ